eukprot:1751973-Amphidinium_carterae.1
MGVSMRSAYEGACKPQTMSEFNPLTLLATVIAASCPIEMVPTATEPTNLRELLQKQHVAQHTHTKRH